MNHHMGSPFGDGPASSWDYQKLASLQARTPRESGVVFIDTHEDSVATGMFLVAPLYYSGWGHFPASRHNGAATLSFTDGHVIGRRWADARTRQPATGYWLYGVTQWRNPDIRWFQDASTVVKRPEYIEQ
jgi:prepilin-type processing-associated H-X9-DG protein